MKIKSDFVTNSSSTCYVVLVPTSFKASDSTIKDHYLQACIDAGQGDEDDITEDLMEKVIEEVHEVIVELQNGGEIYSTPYGDGLDYKIYNTVHNIIHNAGFGITSVETSGDGLDQTVGVDQDKVMKIILENSDITNLIEIEKE